MHKIGVNLEGSESPSQRKAWIEVVKANIERKERDVAFPTEGVD